TTITGPPPPKRNRRVRPERWTPARSADRAAPTSRGPMRSPIPRRRGRCITAPMKLAGRWLVVSMLVAGAATAAPRRPKRPPAKAPAAAADDALAESYYRVGTDLYDGGEFVDAARIFERAVVKAPARAALLFNVASAYDKAGDRDKAILW